MMVSSLTTWEGDARAVSEVSGCDSGWQWYLFTYQFKTDPT
jgi:hypothetical protein